MNTTENTTTENNKIIAEFMGLKPKCECDGVYSYSDMPFYSIRENDIDKVVEGIAKYAKYATDWNWLMQVVEKIEKTHLVDIFGKAVSINEKYDGEMIVDINAKNSLTKIDAVYKACLEFIKLHNKKN